MRIRRCGKSLDGGIELGSGLQNGRFFSTVLKVCDSGNVAHCRCERIVIYKLVYFFVTAVPDTDGETVGERVVGMQGNICSLARDNVFLNITIFRI